MNETPEQIVENTRLMNEEIRKDAFSYENWKFVLSAFEDRWNGIVNRLMEYEKGKYSYDETIPLVQRQLSVLALEMDRVSTRNVLKPGE